MKVLNLVTSPRPFFEQQCKVLEQECIDTQTIQVPRREDKSESRRKVDYIKYYTTVLKQDLGSFDIIHANYGLTAPMALAQPSRPVVLTLWGSDLMNAVPRLSNYCAKHCDAVILPSQAMAPYISTDHTVIPFGIDTELFNPKPQKQARKKVGWKKDSKIVLFPYDTSRDVKRYNLAVQIVEELGTDAELHAIADVPHHMVPTYMNASDAVLVTSKRESGPMVVKEAAVCNVPVVSTDVGFASEVLSDIKNSYVCKSVRELKDRLEAVIESEERSDGQKYADEWGLDRMGDRLMDVYESVLKKQ